MQRHYCMDRYTSLTYSPTIHTKRLAARLAAAVSKRQYCGSRSSCAGGRACFGGTKLQTVEVCYMGLRLKTLTVFLNKLLSKRYQSPSADIIEVLAGLDDVDHVFTDLVSMLETTIRTCLLYTSPSPRDGLLSRMPSSA